MPKGLQAELYHKLLDAYERQATPGRKAYVAFRNFLKGSEVSYEDEDRLKNDLLEAQSIGLIQVNFMTGNQRHLIKSVSLQNPSAIYELLGRDTVENKKHKYTVALMHLVSQPSREVVSLIENAADAWSLRKPYLKFESKDITGFSEFIICIQSLRDIEGQVKDLRTFSAQTLGDSKLIEKYAGRILSYLITIDDLPSEMNETSMLAFFGLEKYPHPVLVGGKLLRLGEEINFFPFIGLPYEEIKNISLLPTVKYILSIENYASFNRYVREINLENTLVIYTGGFPSHSVQYFINYVTSNFQYDAFYHWGDIDPKGLQIAEIIYQIVGYKFQLFLMDEYFAFKGKKVGPIEKISSLSSHNQIQSLQHFLMSDSAHILEQEVCDPIYVATCPSSDYFGLSS